MYINISNGFLTFFSKLKKAFEKKTKHDWVRKKEEETTLR